MLRLHELAISKNTNHTKLLEQGLKLVVDYMTTNDVANVENKTYQEYEKDFITVWIEPDIELAGDHELNKSPAGKKRKRHRRGGRKHKNPNIA